MANTLTLTGFTELIFQAKDIVAAEPCAFIGSTMINSDASERVSINGTVSSFVTAQPTLNASYTPTMTIPDGDDQTIVQETVTISQVANVKIPFKGEIVRQLQNTNGYESVRDGMFAQAFRKIRNAIEAHIAGVVYKGASRATGTAGTTPFASNHNSVNAVRQILVDNGCPVEDGNVSLIMNTLAGTNLRNLSNLYKVNEAGDGALLRRGVLQDISGIMLKESAGVASHTKGTATGGLINNGAGEIVGETTLTLDTITQGATGYAAGDVITYAADTTNKYVVKTGLVAASGDIVINKPGLLIAAPDNNAVTIGNSYTANVAFHRQAVELIIRPPAMPDGGDAAMDRMTVSDDKTGLVFEIAIYGGYGMNIVDITTFYQAKVWKPEFVATLLG